MKKSSEKNICIWCMECCISSRISSEHIFLEQKNTQLEPNHIIIPFRGKSSKHIRRYTLTHIHKLITFVDFSNANKRRRKKKKNL